MRGDFGVFILSHGRADNVVTAKTLKKCGYDGKWWVVIDDEDDQENEYRRLYKERVIQFCKREQAEKTDVGDLTNERRCIIFARNACFEIAKKLGLKYFIELDDDYTDFQYRFDKGGKLGIKSIKRISAVWEKMIEFMERSGATTVAMGQGGDLLGGIESKRWGDKLLRKAMNSFIFRTDEKMRFVGRINEDVNTYTTEGSRGKLFFTPVEVMLVQKTTQKNAGGMSSAYLDMGTYLKSFYSVMMCPSAVKICEMGSSGKRIHHRVYWDNCVPKILSEKYRKRR